MRGRHVVLALAMGCALGACGGGAGGLTGTWTKAMSGEGDVVLDVQSDGKSIVELPAPRWPEASDWTARLSLEGDSLSIADEAGPAACGKPAPRYAAKVEGNALTIGGGGSDPCGARHAVLVGTWTRK
jgi:hypothetical protein